MSELRKRNHYKGMVMATKKKSVPRKTSKRKPPEPVQGFVCGLCGKILKKATHDWDYKASKCNNLESCVEELRETMIKLRNEVKDLADHVGYKLFLPEFPWEKHSVIDWTRNFKISE